MRKFFIASHGRFASGLRSSLEILLGKVENVTIFDAYLDERNVEDEVNNFLANVHHEDQAILLSDLYGGSVNQVLYRFLEDPRVMLVTGVNLALVLELVAVSDAPLSNAELDQLIALAQKAMRQCRLDDEAEMPSDFF
ncbi:hypothetical protein SDC9_105321 [bioreactor metagenome]|uniref:PTS EIIA type-4 domain-containing protein n=1 Tax=bioreactor metagenome TaxID=1076179 RepID=A0A645AZ77_9ZZZZ